MLGQGCGYDGVVVAEALVWQRTSAGTKRGVVPPSKAERDGWQKYATRLREAGTSGAAPAFQEVPGSLAAPRDTPKPRRNARLHRTSESGGVLPLNNLAGM